MVSENWSQASIITNEYKLGIMLDPTDYARERDYRDFGDMFFVRSEDPGEVNNAMDDPKYAEVIEELRTYYEAFKSKTPAFGKMELNGISWEHE